MHNRYSSRVPSGENLAVDDEVRWLRDAGVDVVRHEVTNDDAVAPGLLDGCATAVTERGRCGPAAGSSARWTRPGPTSSTCTTCSRSSPAACPVRPAAGGRPWCGPCTTAGSAAWPAATSATVPHATSAGPGGGYRVWSHRCYAGSAAASALVSVASSACSGPRPGATAWCPWPSAGTWRDGSPRPPGSTRPGSGSSTTAVAAPRVAPADPAAGRMFVFAGRLAAYKGVRLLLDAWPLVPREVGADPAHRRRRRRRRRSARAAADADETVEWVGQVGPDQMGDHLAAARAVLVPSLWNEPFGRVAPEAFAHARPVVTTGRGGLAEIVDDSTGWVTGPPLDAGGRRSSRPRGRTTGRGTRDAGGLAARRAVQPRSHHRGAPRHLRARGSARAARAVWPAGSRFGRRATTCVSIRGPGPRLAPGDPGLGRVVRTTDRLAPTPPAPADPTSTTGPAPDLHVTRPARPTGYTGLLVLLDATAMAAATLTAKISWLGINPESFHIRSYSIPYGALALLTVPTWIVLLALAGAYDLGPIATSRRSWIQVVRARARGLAVIAVSYYVLHLEMLGRGVLVGLVPLAVALTLGDPRWRGSPSTSSAGAVGPVHRPRRRRATQRRRVRPPGRVPPGVGRRHRGPVGAGRPCGPDAARSTRRRPHRRMATGPAQRPDHRGNGPAAVPGTGNGGGPAPVTSSPPPNGTDPTRRSSSPVRSPARGPRR